VDKELLNALFKPKSIALVGASAQKGKIGYTVLENLIQGGYQGKIYPINPAATEIQGLKTFASVLDVPGEIDAAVITIPAKFVLQATEDCGKKV
jgi:acetate---CoA ligase (ADP-forming)